MEIQQWHPDLRHGIWDTGLVLTTYRQHVVSCVDVEDLSQLPESHGAVILPFEVCRRVWGGGFATISWKQLLHLSRCRAPQHCCCYKHVHALHSGVVHAATSLSGSLLGSVLQCSKLATSQPSRFPTCFHRAPSSASRLWQKHVCIVSPFLRRQSLGSPSVQGPWRCG